MITGFAGWIFRVAILGLASGGFISYLPVYLSPNSRATGAGLVGSFWAVLLLKYLPLGVWGQIAIWLLVLMISLPVSHLAEKYLGRKDDPRIVIDEFIGYWTTVLFLPRTFFAVTLGFIFFRIFDTWKPGPIKSIGNLPGGWGVVMDDIAAGLAANFCLHMLQHIHSL
jgi:phosphatidylglycerophosphatase A